MEKIWLNSYPKDVPHEIDADAYRSLVEVFENACENHPEKLAFTSLGHSITYQELDNLSKSFAAFLQQDLGMKKGDRFAIMLPNILQYPVALFAALRCGLSVVNVNPLYTPTEVAHSLEDASVETIIVLQNFAHTVQAALPDTKLKNVIVTQMGDLFPWPKCTTVNFVVKTIRRKVPEWEIKESIDFNHAMSVGDKSHFESIDIDPSDTAFLQYTGGTTGKSKAAVLTHRNMVANLQQLSAWTQTILRPGKEVVITALPLYHIFSLTTNCLLFVKFASQNILIPDPRDLKSFINTLVETPFTVITGVNTLFNVLTNNRKFKALDFSRLHLAISGGMALQTVVAKKWHKITGIPLIEGYGLTETSPVVTVNPLDLQEHNGTIGLPLPSTDISIRNDDNEELPLGESGELVISGPQVMKEYWNNPSETKNVFTSDGFLKTGDIATMDEEGYLKIVDRKKDMILVSGFNVYPNEIEDVISHHLKVLEVAVIGVPAQVSGEAVKAFIVPKNQNLTKEEIIKHCRQELTDYKIPKHVEFREELPKTNVGKVLRRALRD